MRVLLSVQTGLRSYNGARFLRNLGYLASNVSGGYKVYLMAQALGAGAVGGCCAAKSACSK
jgi:rhodanese-related sulfurtransferase